MEIRPPPARTKIEALACYALFIMNIVFPESGMQLESNHDDEGNENIDLMCITLFGKLFRDLH